MSVDSYSHLTLMFYVFLLFGITVYFFYYVFRYSFISIVLLYDIYFFFFFKQKTAYEMLRSLVGSEMCIRDRLMPSSDQVNLLSLLNRNHVYVNVWSIDIYKYMDVV
eukprot:TRINITY_DN62532_c0_g1_i1.p1 TRINITY_DN62532_c0_g1~~TRINITY_DN62532_c0_g1_i1.p1  ORF type:complete len:107 (+),score=19.18 TRINITY_DN62532_c0_g1_i1:1-321(+)